MTPPSDKAELLGLLHAMCDRSITAAQRDRLEDLVRGGGPEARRLFALYMGMVHSLGADRLLRQTRESDGPAPAPEPAPQPAATRRREPRPRRRWVTAAASVVCTVAVAGWLLAAPPWIDAPVAELAGGVDCRWGPGTLPTVTGARWGRGRVWLEEGVAEVNFPGVRVLLEGPAEFEVRAANRARLHRGKLTVRVGRGAEGFAVETPAGTIVDHGAEFGVVAVSADTTDVFDFVGLVELRVEGRPANRLYGGKAARLAPVGCLAISIDSTPFVRALPAPTGRAPRVLEMRDVAAHDPRLQHHYTFEGDRFRDEHLRDGYGDAHLQVTTFGAGRADGVRFVPGLDSSTMAFRPQRTGPTSGGAALVTADRVVLPPRFTVECLVRPGSGEHLAVGGSQDRQGKGHHGFPFPVVGGPIPRELVIPTRLVPGHWYYVAATFDTAGGQTAVSVYLANVTAGQTTVTRVGGRTYRFSPAAAAPLYIGARLVGAARYAFPGTIDEVAIYGDVLPTADLQARLQALADEPAREADGPARAGDS